MIQKIKKFSVSQSPEKHKDFMMDKKMEMQEQTLVERELNQLMEETLRLEAELTLVLSSGRN